MPSSKRPYVQYSIVQLEGLFAKAKAGSVVMGEIEHELSFRKTDRAAKLRLRAQEVLLSQAAARPRPAAAPAKTKTKPTRAKTSSPPAPSPASTPRANRTQHVAAAAKAWSDDLQEAFDPGRPTEPNTPDGVLGAWMALEALSPQTYKRPYDLALGQHASVAELGKGPLPWERGEKSKPNYQLYYQIILGAIPMEKATADLVKAFGSDEEGRTRAREKSAIAAILVDRNGLLVQDNGIAVSSFGWALPLALKLKLEALGAWPGLEPKVVQALDDILRRTDEAGAPLPLDRETIARAYAHLVERFGLPDHLVEAPTFALRVFHYFKAKNPPEASLLNSFFMTDLAKAAIHCRKQTAPRTLRQYLGSERPTHVLDMLNDRHAVEDAVAPARMPAARWPSAGGHSLVLLQQAAVNLARSELATACGMIAVNGPPGTGKTTLLRDIVAAAVLDRALAMAAFDDPQEAFKASGERWTFGGPGFFQLYKLDPSLRGHEVLVASSNNKAVENISRELPAAKAIGRPELSYFKSISDFVYRPDTSEDGAEATAARTIEPLQTWGLIAAVLGNAKNRAAFSRSFWWDDDHGFRVYLKAAKGDAVIREIKDPETDKVIERTTPAVVIEEAPPSPQEATSNWRRARQRLMTLHREIQDELAALEGVRQIALNLAAAKREVAERLAEKASRVESLQRIQSDRAMLDADLNVASLAAKQAKDAIKRHRQNRPCFFAWLFRREVRRRWNAENQPLLAAAEVANGECRQAQQALDACTSQFEALTLEIARADRALIEPRERVVLLDGRLEGHRPLLGRHIIDDAFFERGHEASNLESPWLPEALQRKREDLFIAAMDVHKAFIDASAQKVLHNLTVLMDVFSGGPPQDPAKRALLGELWSTLFMVTPVLSTTFASVERMLGDLPPDSLGWLLVDEAGQALPQAAIGAVMRARRAIIVGDPLQIPPVVTLPERLNVEIADFFKIHRPSWLAPEASTQIVADRVSPFQAAFKSDVGPRQVGIPLLVHRRCQEPMFSISNRIAYDGQMVHTPGQKVSAIGDGLGPSTWHDIDGDADSKWSPDEGEQVVSLLHKIAAAGIRNPDVFVITPFRIVAQELRARLKGERELFAQFGVDIDEWLTDRVGTIHTVQGREAEAVILVLGAPKASQNGARAWAAGTPNILNVAVSRAKQRLYVVGSHGAWRGVGHAKDLAMSLPVSRSR
ncbi:MAG: DEAD/DEAH box helicase [Brevundimonas sp.]|uniref:DEAD/DEAH box helicase n=1 Tax=Brevundimonas sp. TaxID=1871086 RepID=UPI00391CE11F